MAKPYRLAFEGQTYEIHPDGFVCTIPIGLKAVTPELAKVVKSEAARLRKNANRRERDSIRRDMGLVRVRGNLGGTYWE
jgi:hypothetical protein